MFDPPQVAASMIPAKSQPWLHPEARPPGCRWLRAAITRLVATSTMAVLKWLMVQKFAEQQLIGRICLPFLRRFIYVISRLLWDLPFPVAHCQMLWNLNWSGHRIGYACEDSCKHSWKSLFKKNDKTIQSPFPGFSFNRFWPHISLQLIHTYSITIYLRIFFVENEISLWSLQLELFSTGWVLGLGTNL